MANAIPLFRLSPLQSNIRCQECTEWHPLGQRIFEHCWSCGEYLGFKLRDEFPECDECVLRKGDGYRWCCRDEDGTVPKDSLPHRVSRCHWNHAFWGRYDMVLERRALTA